MMLDRFKKEVKKADPKKMVDTTPDKTESKKRKLMEKKAGIKS